MVFLTLLILVITRPPVPSIQQRSHILWPSNIPLCVCTPHVLYLFTCSWTPQLKLRTREAWPHTSEGLSWIQTHFPMIQFPMHCVPGGSARRWDRRQEEAEARLKLVDANLERALLCVSSFDKRAWTRMQRHALESARSRVIREDLSPGTGGGMEDSPGPGPTTQTSPALSAELPLQAGHGPEAEAQRGGMLPPPSPSHNSATGGLLLQENGPRLLPCPAVVGTGDWAQSSVISQNTWKASPWLRDATPWDPVSLPGAASIE